MENTNNIRSVTVKSLFWKFFEKSGSQIIQFIISILLARLLLPEDFGTIALVTIFIQLANVFVQSGLSMALIQKKEIDDLDTSTVFHFSILISITIYGILFICAPFIAKFYDLPILKNVIRILAITIIVAPYNSMQNTILSKKMLFKRLFYSSFSSVAISGIIGVILAFSGYGIWAIVGQQVSAVIITSIVMTFTVKWKPKLIFSFERLKSLYKFGWKMFLSSILETFYNNIYSLMIGKYYSSTDLAYWDRGKQFPSLIITNVNGSIESVMYPIYSIHQDDKYILKKMVRRSIKISAYIVFPMMMGLALCASPIISIVLGQKWLFAVPFLQGWCFCYALMPIHTSNLQVYNALGRSDIFLFLEMIKKAIGFTVLLITIPYGLTIMMLGKMIVSLLSGIINAVPNIKILNYSIKEQLLDLLPTMISTIVMGLSVYACSFINVHYLLLLIIQVIVGVSVYFCISITFKQESYLYIRDFLKTKILKKKI